MTENEDSFCSRSGFIHVYIVLWQQQSKNNLCLMLLLVFKAPWKREWPQQLPWNWRGTQMASINSLLTTSIIEAVFIFQLTASSNMAACCWTASYWWTHYGQTHVISIKGLSEIGAKTASNMTSTGPWTHCMHTLKRATPIVCFYVCVAALAVGTHPKVVVSSLLRIKMYL